MERILPIAGGHYFLLFQIAVRFMFSNFKYANEIRGSSPSNPVDWPVAPDTYMNCAGNHDVAIDAISTVASQSCFLGVV